MKPPVSEAMRSAPNPIRSFRELREFVQRRGIRVIALDVRGTLLSVPRDRNLVRCFQGAVPVGLAEYIDSTVPELVLELYPNEEGVRDWTLVTLLESVKLLRLNGLELSAIEIERAAQYLADEYHRASTPLVSDDRLAFAIRSLGLQGVRTILCADGPQAREEVTLRTHLPQTLAASDFVYTSEAAGVNKLAPTYFEELLSQIGAAAEEMLVIGDRLDKDIAAAKQIGAHGLLVNRPAPDEECSWSPQLQGLLPKSPTRVEIGVALGRFQPFHLEHLRYVLAASSESKRLIVGITRPHGDEDGQPGGIRNSEEANPLPLWLRYELVRDVLKESRIDGSWEVRALPLNPAALRATLPPTSTVFITGDDPWAYEKRRIIRASGLEVKHLSVGRKSISGTVLRKLAREGDPSWRGLMPIGIPAARLREVEDFITGRG